MGHIIHHSSANHIGCDGVRALLGDRKKLGAVVKEAVRLIKRNVVGQNQWASRRNLKSFTNGNPMRLQLVNLFQ